MTTRSRYTAAITDKPWWLAGGIPASACVAAYQPKGASSLAASYTNLANPGVYNAVTSGADVVEWDAINGWKFNGTSMYLNTGYQGSTQQSSMIVKFTNHANAATSLAGVSVVEGSVNKTNFGVIPYSKYGVRYYQAGNPLNVNPSLDSGVLAITRQRGYRNGVYNGAITTPGEGTMAYSLKIGAGHSFATGITYAICYVQCYAIYLSPITDYQVAALTNAMNAL